MTKYYPKWAFQLHPTKWNEYDVCIGNRKTNKFLVEWEYESLKEIERIYLPWKLFYREYEDWKWKDLELKIRDMYASMKVGAIHHNLVCAYCEEFPEVGRKFKFRRIFYYDVLKLAEEYYLEDE